MIHQVTFYESPLGLLKIAGNEQGITVVEFADIKAEESTELPKPVTDCVKQLNEYFSGKRKKFNLELIPEGTEFQKKIWEQLEKIPYGITASYGEIAQLTGNKNASRAVGLANNRNKIVIIIPCHRVIGASGKMVGYGGGLWRKEWLLNFERENTSRHSYKK